ncbi:hypothetical protein SDC9_98902 [bioreactor metagenome]|uniref:Toxin-antitoxin biofilm protein TabA n=1 Tax=bioreactor metagenome TaxID=1076179 RepID=A0A645AGR8_9ZZZZ
MIWAEWKDFSRCSIFIAEAAAAIQEFQSRLTAELPTGSYPLLGEKLKVSIFESKTVPKAERGVFETHRQFADLQTLLIGEELAFVRDATGLTPRMEFDEKQDYQLFEPELENSARIVLNSKRFVVYLPSEAHLTSIGVAGTEVPLRKVVYKIHQSLIRETKHEKE